MNKQQSNIHAQSLIDGSAQLGIDCSIGAFCNIGKDVVIGDSVLLESNVYIAGGSKLGSDLSIGANVTIGGQNYPRANDHNSVVIENGVTIGSAATILLGVTLSKGSCVKAGALVTNSVPPHAIVEGVPASIIGYTSASPGSATEVEAFKTLESPAREVLDVEINGSKLYRLKNVKDLRGDLAVGEFAKEVPFDPRRYFLVYNVPSKKIRGEHAHKECHQFLTCVHGHCTIALDDGQSRLNVHLDSPEIGLHITPLTWATQFNYSADAVLLVLASQHYNESDYIRDYDDFLKTVAE